MTTPTARTVAATSARAARHAGAATAAVLGLMLAPPPSAAQMVPTANPWMNPNYVVLMSKADLNKAIFDIAGATQVDRLGARRIFLLKPADGVTPETLISRLQQEKRFAAVYAGRNRIVVSPESGGLFGAVKNSVNAIGDGEATLARLPKAWTEPWLNRRVLHTLSRGAGIMVAVLDTGIDPAHPWFANRLSRGYDFVGPDASPREARVSLLDAGKGYGHGTHVAGVIASVAPDAKIMPVRVLDANGFGTLWTVAKGIVHAVDPDLNPYSRDGARVLNLSFGVGSLTSGEHGVLGTVMKLASCHPHVVGQVAPLNNAGFSADVVRCHDSLQRTVVVAGQGNNPERPPLYPAAYSNNLPALIPVTASDPRGRRADFASRGAAHEIVAPGQWITSAYPTGDARGNWAIMSGTSMATPWVSGVAALLLAKSPASAPWTGEAVRLRMRGTAAVVCGSAGAELAPVRALQDERVFATACR